MTIPRIKNIYTILNFPVNIFSYNYILIMYINYRGMRFESHEVSFRLSYMDIQKTFEKQGRVN